MKKVAFYIPLLNIGGAERVVIDVLNHLSIDSVDVKYFLILDKYNSTLISQLVGNIELIHLENNQSFGLVQKSLLIYNILTRHKIDCVFSHLTHANIHIFLTKYIFKLKLKIIMVEHNILSKYLDDKRTFKHYLMGKIARLAYSFSDLVVAVSDSVKYDLVCNFKIPANKIYRIYNPINIDRLRLMYEENIDAGIVEKCHGKEVFLNIARLEHQKNHMLLLKAFKRIINNNKFVILLIVGDGSQYDVLNKYIKDNELHENIVLLGHQINPYKYFRLSKIFVLSSYFEGFGIVFLEAMLFNQRIVTTNIDAAREVLEEGRYGVFCDMNEISMEKNIERVLIDGGVKEDLTRKVNYYSISNICNEYLKVIKDV